MKTSQYRGILGALWLIIAQNGLMSDRPMDIAVGFVAVVTAGFYILSGRGAELREKDEE